jgi:hypothetical protein
MTDIIEFVSRVLDKYKYKSLISVTNPRKSP